MLVAICPQAGRGRILDYSPTLTHVLVEFKNGVTVWRAINDEFLTIKKEKSNEDQ